MKTIKSLRKFKSAMLISVLFLAIGSFSSCEKSEDIQPAPSTNVDPLIKTEIIIVEKYQWQATRTNMEAKLACTILPHRSGYEYVKVYVKIKKDHLQTDVWKELPYGPLNFQVENNKVCVQQPSNWDAERTLFMIKVKLKKSPIIRGEKANLNTSNLSTI